MKIIIGTKNQKKIDTTLSVFSKLFSSKEVEVSGHDADSKVPAAPHDEETYQGAYNRALECYQLGGADYYVGIESGLVSRYGNMFEEAWAVILSHDGTKKIGYSSGLMLPDVVVNKMNEGQKHNDVMAYFDTELNAPYDNNDTWSRYTGGSISRQISLEEALRNALIQAVDSKHNLYVYK